MALHAGTVRHNFMLGWVFTAASAVRQYVIRRWFNARIHALATRMAAPKL